MGIIGFGKDQGRGRDSNDVTEWGLYVRIDSKRGDESVCWFGDSYAGFMFFRSMFAAVIGCSGRGSRLVHWEDCGSAAGNCNKSDLDYNLVTGLVKHAGALQKN